MTFVEKKKPYFTVLNYGVLGNCLLYPSCYYFVTFRGRLFRGSCASDQQSVGSSPGHDTCVRGQDALPFLLCHSDVTLSLRPHVGLSACKRTQSTSCGRVRGSTSHISGSHTGFPKVGSYCLNLLK